MADTSLTSNAPLPDALSPQPTLSTISTTTPTPDRINLRIPSKYQTPSSAQKTVEWTAPSNEWLARMWAVTHSTLPMWRKAKNVRITYALLPTSGKDGEGVCLDDTVESEPTSKTLLPQPKSIRGIDTPDPKIPAAWNWRGKGWLRIASSHWEVLGWGEREWKGHNGKGVEGEKERWVVTWFAPSMFTPAGVDVYSDRMEGGSSGLVEDVLRALEGLGAEEVAKVCREEMRVVKIDKES